MWELCLISISNIRLLLVAVPSYYWTPPPIPLSSSAHISDVTPLLPPPGLRCKIFLLGEREGEEERSMKDWVDRRLTDWGLQQLISQAELIFLIKYKLGVLLAVTKTSPLLALWDWLNTEELSLILTLLFRQLGYVFISE